MRGSGVLPSAALPGNSPRREREGKALFGISQ